MLSKVRFDHKDHKETQDVHRKKQNALSANIIVNSLRVHVCIHSVAKNHKEVQDLHRKKQNALLANIVVYSLRVHVSIHSLVKKFGQ